MAKGKIITKEEKKKLQSLPIKLNFKLERTDGGTATYDSCMKG
jgi:penicillin-binding protein 1A